MIPLKCGKHTTGRGTALDAGTRTTLVLISAHRYQFQSRVSSTNQTSIYVLMYSTTSPTLLR